MFEFLSGAYRRRRSLQRKYARQRQELEASGAPCRFLSPFDILKDRSGREFSYGVWPKDVEAFLPRTECIALTDGATGIVVAWEDVVALAGDLLTSATGFEPERHKTLGWPAPEQLEELRKRAVIAL